MAPAVVWVMFHWRSSVSDFTGADGPRVASHALKSRFIPYFRTTEQSLSFPLELLTPEHWFHSAKFWSGSGLMMLGMLAGSTISAPCSRRTAMASVMTRDCSG